MTKKRILYCGEASYVKSGYGAYSRELLGRLHATGKYEIAELAAFGLVNQLDDDCIKWKYYANAIDKGDPRQQDYNSHHQNASGAWRFERVLLDFKPDIVITWRDPWVDSFIIESPLRDYFNFVWMPTADSIPLKQEFIEYYANADVLLAYSDWSLAEMKKVGLKNAFKSAPPCPAPEMVPNMERAKLRQSVGLQANDVIVGTVMRNQKRKLFPDLMAAFRKYLDKCAVEDRELGERSYLYLHTSYPDNACWDIPMLIKEHNLCHKVLMTYKCKNCNDSFVAFFQDARTVCPHCNCTTAVFPNVGNGITEAELAQIYNLFDVYVQYSTNEGFGIPLIEAAACGIPVMGVDYSAPEDIVRKLNGTPLKVERLYFENETHAYRALPDNQFLADKLFEFFSLPQQLRVTHGFQAYQGIQTNYTWDKTQKVWEDAFDSLNLPKRSWSAPPRDCKPKNVVPPNENCSNYEFVAWVYTNLLQRPDLINTYAFSNIVHDLNYGVTPNGSRYQPFHRNVLMSSVAQKIANQDFWEQARVGNVKLQSEDYIEYANLKQKSQEQYEHFIHRTI